VGGAITVRPRAAAESPAMRFGAPFPALEASQGEQAARCPDGRDMSRARVSEPGRRPRRNRPSQV